MTLSLWHEVIKQRLIGLTSEKLQIYRSIDMKTQYAVTLKLLAYGI